MSNSLLDFDSVTQQLKNIDRRKKPKMLVVDDEPDNLDLLYRTFRRDFRVYKADSGMQALEVLSEEGEVAVIISDQRMPEMKGTEFLSQTVPQFPDTVRIILTGFTDVEDLVEAINSGQVYKYITKPWDPNELKAVVDRAAETYDLLKQRTEELNLAQQQIQLSATIVQITQEYQRIESALEPLATAIGQCFNGDGCVLQAVKDGALVGELGRYSSSETLPIALESDPFVKDAIASGEIRAWTNSASNPPPEGAEAYQSSGLQLHLVVPAVYQKEVLAVLSLQWQKSTNLEQELKLIHLSAQHLGVALKLIATNA
ncbi:response regulator [Lusitaniella coriacea LEGE 07157]|uniref:Response regulator n=1 Tax=Lusitaniella coriacea LEGE 07157 TaxID=945747 RepID=A0A8J7B3E8_9CYAN|nr:response regulator [Lusitaniella coriacea]MBE9115007.1 response regulator [Lusitaniella coriacea LEGE 07157]